MSFFSLKSIEEEKAKFVQADENRDGLLEASELAAFNAPYHYPHMAEHAVAETLRYQDRDGDGQLSLAEYLGGK